MGYTFRSTLRRYLNLDGRKTPEQRHFPFKMRFALFPMRGKQKKKTDPSITHTPSKHETPDASQSRGGRRGALWDLETWVHAASARSECRNLETPINRYTEKRSTRRREGRDNTAEADGATGRTRNERWTSARRARAPLLSRGGGGNALQRDWERHGHGHARRRSRSQTRPLEWAGGRARQRRSEEG